MSLQDVKRIRRGRRNGRRQQQWGVPHQANWNYQMGGGEIPLSGSVAGFAGDVGAVLTRQDLLLSFMRGIKGSRQGPKGDR